MTQQPPESQAEQARQVAISLYQRGQFREAAEVQLLVVGYTRQNEGERSATLAREFGFLGLLYKNAGVLDRAEDCYRYAIDVLQSGEGESGPELAAQLNNLGVLYKQQGRLPEAKKLYESALRIRRANYPEVSQEVVNSLINLGALDEMAGNLDDARGAYMKALQSAREFGDEHPAMLVTALNNLASLYSSQQQPQLAADLLGESLSHARRIMPPEHPHLQIMLARYGLMLFQLERHQEVVDLLAPMVEGASAPDGAGVSLAIDVLDAAREKLASAGPIAGPETAEVQIDLSGIDEGLRSRIIAAIAALTQSGSDRDLRQLLDQHPELESRLGHVLDIHSNALDVQSLLQEMASTKDPEEQIRLSRRVIARIERERTPDLWFRLQGFLGAALLGNQHDSAAERIEEAIEAMRSALEVEPPKVSAAQWASLLSTLAMTYRMRRLGDPSENLELAIAAYERALKVPEHRLQPHLYAGTQNNLANAYNSRRRGDRDENLTRAVLLFQQVLGAVTRDGNPTEWARTQNNLGSAYSNFVQQDLVANRDRAIRAYQEALTVRTLESTPEKWAETTMNLGNAWRGRLSGDRAGNLRDARACYLGTLQVWTRETAPELHRGALEMLGIACLEDRHLREFSIDRTPTPALLIPLTEVELRGLLPEYPELRALHALRSEQVADSAARTTDAPLGKDQQLLRSLQNLFLIERADQRRKFLEFHKELRDARIDALIEDTQRASESDGSGTWGMALVAMTEERVLLARWRAAGIDSALKKQQELESREDCAEQLARELTVAAADAGRATRVLRQLVAAEDAVTASLGRAGSTAVRTRYLDAMRQRLSRVLGVVLATQKLNPWIAAPALDLTLRRKGIESEVSTNYRDFAATARNEQFARYWQDVQELRRMLAEKILARAETQTFEQYIRELMDLRLRLEECELRLSDATPDAHIHEKLRDVSCESLARILPADGALIEFLSVPVAVDSGVEPGRHYLAWILRSGRAEQPTLVDLGPVESIDSKVAALRAALTSVATEEAEQFSGAPGKDDAWAAAARELRFAVFELLRTALDGVDTLYVSPDGELAQLPFEILWDESDGFLIDEYRFRYLPFGRDLARIAAQNGHESGRPLVMADPDYEFQGEVAGQSPERRIFFIEDIVNLPDDQPGGRPLEHPDLGFESLPGARTEGLEVAQQLGVQALVGAEARKPALMSARSPRILHLATHGFFLEDPGQDPLFRRNATLAHRLGKRLFPRHEDPMMRSWLVFASVNAWLHYQPVPPNSGNCVLTGAEAATLDLRGTELVVLSACESGLGVVQAGEGVMGLRRAFALSGAHTVVMTLWRVSDLLTRELMKEFYERLLAGEPRADALRSAQLRIKGECPHPLCWGGFICEGDWRPLGAGTAH